MFGPRSLDAPTLYPASPGLSPSASSSLSSASSSSSHSWQTTVRNGCMSGRLPLVIVLLCIIWFVTWHVEHDNASHRSSTLGLQLFDLERHPSDAGGSGGAVAADGSHEESDSHAAAVAALNANPRHRLPVRAHYRCLVVGDSLTVGQYHHPSSAAVSLQHPYLTNLEHLLTSRHPHLSIEFIMDAQEGECVISKCRNKSLIQRVSERMELQQRELERIRELRKKSSNAPGSAGLTLADELDEHEYFDFAIIMAGTNDIFHDFAAQDILEGLKKIHRTIWEQGGGPKLSSNLDAEASNSQVSVPSTADSTSSPFHGKTLALSVLQFGNSDSWRPPHRQTKLLPLVASKARGDINKGLQHFCEQENAEKCTFVNFDNFFPRQTLKASELQRKWSEDVHPTPAGYDEMGLIIYQHLLHVLPLN